MLEGIYIVIAVLLFFAQLQNGFFTALLTAVFWPIVIVGMGLYLFFNMLYLSVKKPDPYKDLEKELASRNITHVYLIYDSDRFRNEYLPEHLKLIENTVDGETVIALPNLENRGDYLLFVDAISRFWEDHSLVHQTMKGYSLIPKNQF